MNILMIGSGGREHALIKKLLESPKCTKLYCAPGNGGISRDAQLVDIDVMDKENMVKFAKENNIEIDEKATKPVILEAIEAAVTVAVCFKFAPSKAV